MWKLETTQIDKVDVGWLIHKYQLSQALSSLQDNLEDYWIFLLPLSPSLSSLTTPILPPYFVYYYPEIMGDK